MTLHQLRAWHANNATTYRNKAEQAKLRADDKRASPASATRHANDAAVFTNFAIHHEAAVALLTRTIEGAP